MPHDHYALIPHAKEPAVLLRQGATGWTLPQHDTDDASEINVAIKAQLGCDTTVLYCAYDRYKDDERDEQHRVYVLENHSPNFLLPTDTQWINRADLAGITLAVADHYTVIEQWLREAEEGTQLAQPRVPWAYPGWFSSATQWVQEQITTFGLPPIGSLEQVQVSPWSTVLRISTTNEVLYFKASAPVFAYEPVLTWQLAQLVPTSLPPVLAIEQDRHWMLMRDAGTPLSQLTDLRADPAQWEEVLRQYAHMQVHLIGQQATLLAAGCPDRRLDQLPTLLEDALGDTSLLMLDREHGLPAAAYAQLQASIPQVKAWCDELQRYGIPETLHHDDLHGSNILYNAQGFLFFDWAECAITHPFCSLVIVERVFHYVLKFSPETIAHLRNCYLQQWTQFAPMEHLQAAYTIAQRLGKLCRALTWGHLLAHLSPDERWEYEASFPYWLQVFLGTEE